MIRSCNNAIFIIVYLFIPFWLFGRFFCHMVTCGAHNGKRFMDKESESRLSQRSQRKRRVSEERERNHRLNLRTLIQNALWTAAS